MFANLGGEGRPITPDFEAAMREALRSSSPAVAAAVGHLMGASGKRLRPLLVHLAASFGDAPPTAVRDVAVAAELIHLASLVHDDILDGAGHRRGQAALHVLHGEGAATLVGDFLFSRAFGLLARHAHFGVVATLTAAIARMCEGELDQRARRGDLAVTAGEYLERAANKTGALMAACARAGAQVAGLPEPWQDCLHRYGLYLGCAFQVIDDVLDFTAETATVGKPVRLDLRRGVITLPVICALDHPACGPGLRRLLASLNGEGDDRVAEACRLVAMSGGLDRAADAAAGLLRNARSHLDGLPSGAARAALEHLAVQLAARLPTSEVRGGMPTAVRS